MIKLNQRNLAVRHCASKDPTRYGINGVHFDKGGEVVATNGHILAVVKGGEPHDHSFSLLPAALADAVKLTRPKTAPDVEMEQLAGPCCWSIAGAEHRELDVDYVSWRPLFDRRPDIHHTATLSLHVLEALVATVRQYAGGTKGDEYTHITFEFPKTHHDVVRAHHEDLEFLIMSVRPPSE